MLRSSPATSFAPSRSPSCSDVHAQPRHAHKCNDEQTGNRAYELRISAEGAHLHKGVHLVHDGVERLGAHAALLP
eukprot:6204738-Pleurochrysis_carterae.AAC.1